MGTVAMKSKTALMGPIICRRRLVGPSNGKKMMGIKTPDEPPSKRR
jgi:hypothetical protein